MNPDSPLVLDLGCGTRKTPGAVGVDRVAAPGVDVVCNFDVGLPFADSSVDEIITSHVVEHVADLSKTMEDIWRICRPGARVRIWTPHFSSGMASWSDPTHRRTFTSRTFEYFLPESNTHYLRARFRIEAQRLHYHLGGVRRRSPSLWHGLEYRFGRWLEGWANRNRINMQRAERFVSRLIPFEELYVELRAEKNP
ncbi:MAG TPA: methyltransferase domain-containing protein [Candidatus Xenobia bacterium]|nr:methyltransferase domain-containing protein [Candidatus Xenobia bacterium]